MDWRDFVLIIGAFLIGLLYGGIIARTRSGRKKRQKLHGLYVGEKIWIGDDLFLVQDYSTFHDHDAGLTTEIKLSKLFLSDFIKKDLD